VSVTLVRYAGGAYPVTVASGARSRLRSWIDEHHRGRRVAVITDDAVRDALGSPVPGAPVFTFPSGEASKTRTTWAQLTDDLLAQHFDRHALIIASGGGVATDLAGFVAATFLRGVPWIAVPTTTLGMLDAAIGGKTGVNTATAKNLVGAFHPPQAVCCDPETLATLPDAHFRGGLAEAVKHAATLDADYGRWMMASADSIGARDTTTLETLITRSVEIKAAVVSQDEREADRRAVLNAGHTVAHGLERASDYSLSHGHAVAVGLMVETRAGELMGVTAPGTADQIAALLHALKLPTEVPSELKRDAVIAAMHEDKKNRHGEIHAALIRSFGSMAGGDSGWTQALDLRIVSQVLQPVR
jgi:3-dehydroquinate synthase